MICEINSSVECTAKSVDECEHIWNCQNNRSTRKIDEIAKILEQTLLHINELTKTVNYLSDKLTKKGVNKNVGRNSTSKAILVK